MKDLFEYQMGHLHGRLYEMLHAILLIIEDVRSEENEHRREITIDLIIDKIDSVMKELE